MIILRVEKAEEAEIGMAGWDRITAIREEACGGDDGSGDNGTRSACSCNASFKFADYECLVGSSSNSSYKLADNE
jgi:hypothetical protein